MAFGFRKTATAVKNTGWIDNSYETFVAAFNAIEA
jgi:hypothetical protein